MACGPRDAVAVAKEYVNSVFDGSVRNLRLEEIELKGSVWLVTLSWIDPDAANTSAGALAGVFNVRLPRIYKVFEIDSLTGEVQAKDSEPHRTMSAPLTRIIRLHARKGILVDTNLLVLLVLGMFERSRIPRFERLSAYTVEDYDLQAHILSSTGSSSHQIFLQSSVT